MKRVYILRGLPGMGKSTIAKLLAAEAAGDVYEQDAVVTICSADEYFVKDGVYQWFRQGVHTAHVRCQDKFLQALNRDAGIVNVVWPNVVIVDNTNVKHSDYKFYVEEAKTHGFEVFVLAVGTLDVETSYARNKHGVPRETIQAMANRWQP